MIFYISIVITALQYNFALSNLNINHLDQIALYLGAHQDIIYAIKILINVHLEYDFLHYE